MTLPRGSTFAISTTLEDCRAVVAVQEAVWGTDGETVPASVLSVSRKRGGILIGAFPPASSMEPAAFRPPENLIGFVWSLPGVRDGAPTQWSHMLAVLPDVPWRPRGRTPETGPARRGRSTAGVDVDRVDVRSAAGANAHFNLHVLGAVGASYGVDVYGSLRGPLHRGTPTDRLIVEWWIAEPHVARRVAGREWIRRRRGCRLAAPTCWTRQRSCSPRPAANGPAAFACADRLVRASRAGRCSAEVFGDAAAGPGGCARMALDHARRAGRGVRARVPRGGFLSGSGARRGVLSPR